MRLLVPTLVVVAVAVPSLNGDDTSAEYKGLQGTWEVVGGVENGKKFTASDPPARDTRFTFRGGKLCVSQGRIRDVGDVIIFSRTEPRALDFVQVMPCGITQKMMCIIERNGDTLKIALQADDDTRPADFSGKDPSVQVFVCERRRN